MLPFNGKWICRGPSSPLTVPPENRYRGCTPLRILHGCVMLFRDTGYLGCFSRQIFQGASVTGAQRRAPAPPFFTIHGKEA